MCRCRATLEQSRGRKDERSGADACHQFGLTTLLLHPLELLWVSQLSTGALSSRIDQHLQGRRIGVRVLGFDDQALGTLNETAGSGKRGDRPAILGVPAAPERQHFPRTYRIQLFYLRKQQDPDPSG